MIAATKSAYVKIKGKEDLNSSPRRDYSKERIHQIITKGSAVELSELSTYFFSISGLYKRIILHYATFLTYSWILVPHVRRFGDKMSDKKNQKVYFDAAEFCSSFGIEEKSTLFAVQVLVKGGYYGLIHDDGESIVIQDLPFEFCRSRFKNAQDVRIIEFDMKFFDTIRDDELRKQILKTYPKVVQKGYRRFKEGGEQWIFLPADLGIYFTFFEEKPFFIDLIPLIDDLEDYKQIDKDRNMLSLKRIITQEVPHDGMNLVFEPEEASEMHEGVLEMLSNNPDVDVVTSYAKVNLLDLSGDADDKTEVSTAQQLIYDSAGVSSELFSSKTEAGLQLSLNNDLAMMMILGRNFGHFFTALINNKFGNKKISFKLLILPVSFYNNKEYTSQAKDMAAFGYSFLTPILSTGIDQTNLVDLKTLEMDVLNLDEYLKPLQSSYTQSGKVNAVTAAAAKTSDNTAQEESETQDDDTTDNDDNVDENEDEVDKETDTDAEEKSGGGED